MPDNIEPIATDSEREALHLAEKLGVIPERTRAGFSERMFRSMAHSPVHHVKSPPWIERHKIIDHVRYQLGHDDAESMSWQELADVLRDELDRRDAPDPETGTKELPWGDIEGFIAATDVVKLADRKTTLSALSKVCTPDGPIRFMRKGRRLRVNVTDFTAWVRTLGVADSFDNVDAYVDDIERRKAEALSKKTALK